MQTDARGHGLSAILLQEKYIIGIYGYKLKKSQKNYTSIKINLSNL